MVGILFPDVEAHLISTIRAALLARTEPVTANVWVGNVLPKPAPERAVLVRDDGGPHLGDVRGVARLGVNVWAGSHEDVSDLANLVSAIVGGSADGAPVVRATASRPYSVTDDAARPRHYFTAELIVRGSAL